MADILENPFQADWTAKGSLLCLGHWEVTFQGCPILLPKEKEEKEMGTYGIYSFLYEDDPDFAEGLTEDDWIVANADWLAQVFVDNDIPIDKQHMQWFYQAVNRHDWRCGSCGGCI